VKQKKDFDCVEMKWEAQRKLREQYAGIPEREARRMQWERTMADPILGPFLAKVLSKVSNPPAPHGHP
jgi:hypothetical protein